MDIVFALKSYIWAVRIRPRSESLRPCQGHGRNVSDHGRNQFRPDGRNPSMDGRNSATVGFLPSMDGIPGRTDGGRFWARIEFRPWAVSFRPWAENIPSGRNWSVHGRNSKSEFRPWTELLRPWTESIPSGRTFSAHGRTELFTDGKIPSVNGHGRTDGLSNPP